MKNVVIIGAGPAGLSCAYEILKNNKNIKVTIFEEEEMVGGISKTVNYKGNRIDIGGHRFFTKNEEVKKLWLELLPLQNKPAYDDKILNIEKKFPKKGKNPEKDDSVMLIRNRVSRIYYNHKFFDYPVNFNFKTIKNMGFATTCSCGVSYLKSIIHKLDEFNLENFYINRFGKKLYSMFFEGYTTKVWGKTPCEIDSSWGSQRVKGISISKVMVDYFKRIFHFENNNKETSLIESFYYPKYGPGQLYETLAEEVKKLGGKIIKNAKVVKVKKNNEKITSIIYLKDNRYINYRCNILVSSMPLKDLILNMNDVPKKITKISSNLPYRDFVTVGLLVPSFKVEDSNTIHGSVNDNWIYVQDKNVKLGRIQIFNNWSPYMVKDPVNNIWMGLEYFCQENDEFWTMRDKDIVNMAKEELKSMQFYEGKILDSIVIRVKKAYPAYFDSYKNIDEVRKYINNIDNLYCIGRNGTHSYNNMDHSIYSGLLCSRMINKEEHDLDKLWNVNVDKSYHEEK